MDESEVAVTNEALHQYIIIRKLYMDLEEEREASATAASEALSMILRLQREKATEKMEACQYKRIAEEKMHHAEQCLMILEEAMQQKDIEIKILKRQLQLYRKKLLSNGISDLEFGDIRTGQNLSSCGDSALLDKTGLHGHVRRNFSLPSLRLCKFYSEIDSNENSSSLPSGQTIWKTIGDYTDQFSDRYKEIPNSFQESATNDHNSEEVNGKVRYALSPRGNVYQTTTSNSSLSLGEESSCSWYSALTGETVCRTKLGTGVHLDAESVSSLPSQAEEQVNTAESAWLSISNDQIESERNAFHSACVHDIFEVPESNKYRTGTEPKQLFLEEYMKETDDCLDRVFTYSTPTTGISILKSDMVTPRKGEMMNYNSVLVESGNGTCFTQKDFEHIKCQLQQFEYEKVIKMEDSERSGEQLKLLRAIYEQLNTIECHLKNSKSSKCPQDNESQFVSVMELSRFDGYGSTAACSPSMVERRRIIGRAFLEYLLSHLMVDYSFHACFNCDRIFAVDRCRDMHNPSLIMSLRQSIYPSIMLCSVCCTIDYGFPWLNLREEGPNLRFCMQARQVAGLL